MKKVLFWMFIIALLGVGGYFGSIYLYKKQSFKVFTKEHTYTVKVYFGDEIKDPKHAVCDHAIPFTRTITSSEIGIPLRTIETLLAGPTKEEIAQGAYTAIPKSSKLLHFEIKDEETDVVIDYDFKRSDKCIKEMIETQIQNTLFQFDDVPEVKINPVKLLTS
jgi:spore germination protein GerM